MQDIVVGSHTSSDAVSPNMKQTEVCQILRNISEAVKNKSRKAQNSAKNPKDSLWVSLRSYGKR
jgi:hypothetical protein